MLLLVSVQRGLLDPTQFTMKGIDNLQQVCNVRRRLGRCRTLIHPQLSHSSVSGHVLESSRSKWRLPESSKGLMQCWSRRIYSRKCDIESPPPPPLKQWCPSEFEGFNYSTGTCNYIHYGLVNGKKLPKARFEPYSLMVFIPLHWPLCHTLGSWVRYRGWGGGQAGKHWIVLKLGIGVNYLKYFSFLYQMEANRLWCKGLLAVCNLIELILL